MIENYAFGMRNSKRLSTSFSAFLTRSLLFSLTGCGGVAAKALDLKRCDDLHVTVAALQIDYPYVGRDPNGPTRPTLFTEMLMDFPYYDGLLTPSDKGGDTDSQWEIFTSKVKNLNIDLGTAASYSDVNEIASNFFDAANEFGKACENAGAGDAFKNGL